MRRIRAICTDIDGTLLNADRQLSDRLLRIMRKIPKEVPFILASSRMPDAMRHLLRTLERPHEALICYNGAYVLLPDARQQAASSPQQKVLADVPIPVEVCAQLLALPESRHIHLSLYQGEHWYEPTKDQWTLREIRNTQVEPDFRAAEEVLQYWQQRGLGAHKVMCMGEAAAVEAFTEAARALVNQQIHLYRSKDTYLEMAPKAISKAHGLRQLLGAAYTFGLEDVVAFGDNYNDTELLRAVGLGVAVANAQEEVLQVADAHTATNKEDGVALFLEKLYADGAF
ncbi:Cof-type HAD-IIB family hydrolase [Nitritalea halalkaliphila]|nr:Cof-type HAD-IIB family hydrolase [Nitritalea halalkaliphila]